MIISIINQKGGTGKTTVACNLAVAFKLSGHNVCMIDADPQGTAAQFRANRKELDVPQLQMFQILKDTLEDDVPQLGFDTVIIDIGGRDTKAARSCMVISDMVIVPCKMSSADIWSTEATLSVLRDAKKFNKKLRVYGLFNMVDPKVKVTKDIPDLVESLETEYGISFFKTKLINRVQYSYMLGIGYSILEQVTDNKAKDEFNQLFDEVKNG